MSKSVQEIVEDAEKKHEFPDVVLEGVTCGSEECWYAKIPEEFRNHEPGQEVMEANLKLKMALVKTGQVEDLPMTKTMPCPICDTPFESTLRLRREGEEVGQTK